MSLRTFFLDILYKVQKKKPLLLLHNKEITAVNCEMT